MAFPSLLRPWTRTSCCCSLILDFHEPGIGLELVIRQSRCPKYFRDDSWTVVSKGNLRETAKTMPRPTPLVGTRTGSETHSIQAKFWPWEGLLTSRIWLGSLLSLLGCNKSKASRPRIHWFARNLVWSARIVARYMRYASNLSADYRACGRGARGVELASQSSEEGALAVRWSSKASSKHLGHFLLAGLQSYLSPNIIARQSNPGWRLVIGPMKSPIHIKPIVFAMQLLSQEKKSSELNSEHSEVLFKIKIER